MHTGDDGLFPSKKSALVGTEASQGQAPACRTCDSGLMEHDALVIVDRLLLSVCLEDMRSIAFIPIERRDVSELAILQRTPDIKCIGRG